MTITNAKIEWHPDFDNAPTLYIEVDGFLPSNADYRYEQRGAHFFAQHESGFCSFLYWAGPSDEGYGGRIFNITMIDGTKRSLKGPWSGNETSMAAAGFPISYSGRAKARCNWGNGWSESNGIHMIESLWLDTIARFCPDAHVVKSEQPVGSPDLAGEQNAVIGYCGRSSDKTVTSYLIARKGMTFAQSQALKRVVRSSRYAAEVYNEVDEWDKERTPESKRLGHVTYVNELIAKHGLQEWQEPFDLNDLPPLLPARPPKPPIEYDCDENGEPYDY